MSHSDGYIADGFIAIDVGSSRVKLGWFPSAGECTSELKPSALPIAAPRLPQPEATLAVSHQDQAALWSQIGDWLQEFCPQAPRGFIASVHPDTAALVQEMFGNRLRPIVATDLSIDVRVEQPERVGIDRLLNAVAASRLRQSNRSAIVVDLGTAGKVDLIGPDGAFEGGAILPGVNLSAKSLHTGTASLPQLCWEDFDTTAPVVGKSTKQAITSGIYWGIIGAVRELVARMSQACDQPPQLFFTGGGAQPLVLHLSDDETVIRHIPNLVLVGVALVAEARS